MKRIVMVLVFVLILSLSVTAFAAGSPVAGPAKVTPKSTSTSSSTTVKGTAAKQNDEMKAVVEASPELKGATSVKCEEMKVVDADGKSVEGKAQVSVAVKGVKADSKVYVVVYKDGKAKLVKAKVVDGKVVFTADFPCTVEIFVVDEAGSEAPKTGISSLFAWLF